MRNRASIGLALAVMAVAAFGVYGALGWPLKAKLFPLVIAIPLFFLASAEAAWTMFGRATKSDAVDFQMSDHLPRAQVLRRTLLAAGWILGFFALILLLGFKVAVPLFVLLYLRLQGREGWVLSLAFAFGLWAFFYGLFDYLLHLPFPAGWIQTWIGIG